MQKRLYAASVDARRRGPAVRAWHLAVLALGVVVAVLHSLRSTRSTPLGGLRAKRAPASAADYAIPALIWQTWFTSDLFPAAAARVAQTKRLNPGHAHRLVNDTEAAAFMRRHFAGRVANAYFAINPVLGAARADLWRYCVLYKFGGFYLDLDVKCDRPLRALHSPGAKLVHTHEHTPLPAKPPKALDCIAAAVRPGRASQLFSPRRVAALGLPQTTVAQYFLGAAPKDPVLKLVIDDVVRSIEALDEGRCGTPKTFSARDRQKHHTWTWLRTIWLTGPFALTVAFHNYTHAHGRSPAVVALDFKQGVLHGACETDKVLNAAMDRAHVRYARLDDKAALQPVRTTLRRTALRAGELAQSDLQKTPPKAGIQFYDDLWESTVPDVKLTRSPDAQTGVAKFFFAKPSFFNCASESDIPSGAISAMTMVDEEGRMSTTNVDANFVNGLPQTISVTYVMYSPAEWERFLRFMGSYAEVNGLGFKKS